MKMHIDCILTETIVDGNVFVFDSPYRTNYFGGAQFTDTAVEKLNNITHHEFDMKKCEISD